jgi:hypothetical protein
MLRIENHLPLPDVYGYRTVIDQLAGNFPDADGTLIIDLPQGTADLVLYLIRSDGKRESSVLEMQDQFSLEEMRQAFHEKIGHLIGARDHLETALS